MKISPLEQQIYNTHLKFSRNNKAWTPRKDFSSLSEEILIILAKLKDFFTKFNHLDLNCFFEAPLLLHPEERYPDLKFFSTRKAIRCYKLVCDIKENESPEKQISFIKEGLKFITNFCIQKNITWNEYLSFKEEYMPCWIQHYKEHKINIYNIVLCDNHQFITNLAQEDIDTWLPDFLNKFFSFKNRLHNSSNLKTNLLQVIDSIKKIILTEKLKNSK